MAVQDLNADGNLDLAVTYAQTNGLEAMLLSVFLGKGEGNFQSRVDYPLGGSPTSAVVGISDVNGDGKPDLVAARSDLMTSVFLGNGDGSFQPPVASPGIAQAATVGFGDLNGDGKQDLVIAGYPCGTFRGRCFTWRWGRNLSGAESSHSFSGRLWFGG